MRAAGVSKLARRRRGTVMMAAAMVAGLAGCGRAPLTSQFLAERDLWRARMVERRIELHPGGQAPDLAPAIQAYEHILKEYPLGRASDDTMAVNALGRVRVTAAQTLARLYFRQGSRSRAIEVLWAEKEALRSVPPALIGVYGDLAQLLARSSNADSLEALYREMIVRLPPGTPKGTPYPPVIEAPARLGELFSITGRTTEARTAFGEALDYYEQVARDNPGTPLQVAAYVQKANVLARLNRPREAEQALHDAQEMPAAGPVAAGILFSQAVLREQLLREPLSAISLYRQVLERWPESDPAAQASLRIGIAFAATAQGDSALRAFDRAEQLFARNLALAAQARYLGSKVLMESGRAEESIRRLRSVTTDFPRTDVGLMAPLDIAAYYEKAGDLKAEKATLREAEAAYLRFCEDLRDDPRQGDLVRAALDRLAEARTRLQDWPGAVAALLQRADAFPGDERSPLALAQAAALSDAKLTDREGSVRILQSLVDRYPRHPMAVQAKEKIAELGGSGS